MPLVPIQIPPGMFRNGTQYEASGRWYDGNLIRWENQRLKPIGGWIKIAVTSGPTAGVPRGGIAFEDNVGNAYLLIGTNLKLYKYTGGLFLDRTPAGFNLGNAGSILSFGYGSGNYNDDTYGTPRLTSISPLTVAAATWQFDTFGNSVVMCCSSDRSIYQFTPPDTFTNLSTAAVDPAPYAVGVMTTNEDFLVALGAAPSRTTSNARRIQWADVGTSTVWAPAITNSAGGINLNTEGKILAGTRVGAQNLIWTDSDCHLLNYIGPPGIYAPVRIGTHCGLIGPQAWATTDIAYWMGIGGFFLYNGIVQPMECDVQDFLWRIIDFSQPDKIYAATNTRFNEVIWFFPSVLGPVDPVDMAHENDSYVIYNYKEKVWYFGIQSSLGARTTWIDRGVFPYAGATDPQGNLYEQEVTYTANGAPRIGQVRARSGFNEIATGDQIAYANLLLPDIMTSDGSPPGVNANILTAFSPSGPVTTQTVPITPNAEGYVPVRVAGRQIAVELINTTDADWSLGKPRLYIKPGGRR